MKAMFGLLGLLATTAIGFYAYSVQIHQAANAKPLAQQSDLVAVKGDLLALAQSERLYLATNGSYGTLEQLQQSGTLSSFPENSRHGYVYIAEMVGPMHFRITAKPADSSRAEMPTLSIDETMQIKP